MFDIGQYYTQAHSGEPVENTELLNYIKSFPQIVLWGGGVFLEMQLENIY